MALKRRKGPVVRTGAIHRLSVSRSDLLPFHLDDIGRRSSLIDGKCNGARLRNRNLKRCVADVCRSWLTFHGMYYHASPALRNAA